MNDVNFICPTCKRPTHPTDNEIIEFLVKEKARHLDALGKRTKELERTRKALEIAKDTLHWYDDNYDSVVAMETLKEITTLEQKDEK